MNAITRPPAGRAKARRLGLILAALTVGLAARSAARADNIDEKLIKKAPDVMKYLDDHHYRNVGVLKFRVELGKKPASFNVGPINSNLAKRLQTALVLVNDPEKPVGLLEDPNKVAADKKLPGYLSPAGRDALFQTTFPLAWGDARVKADAFLAGVVKVEPDMRKGVVVVEAFDGQNPKQTAEVVRFDFASDRDVLSDLGQNFVVKRAVNVRDEDEGDKLAADNAADHQEAKVPPPAPADSPIQLEISYDGAVQQPTPDKSNPGGLSVPEPQEMQAVSFVLTNNGKERLGAVLKVNGKSTLYEEEDEPSQCTRWILDPGDRYELKGFTVKVNDEKKEIPFKILSAAESQAVAYTDNLGIFQLCVFRSGGAAAGESLQVSRKLNLRGLSSLQAAKAPRPRSLRDLQASTHKATGTTHKRGLVVKDPDAAGASNETQLVAFPNPVQISDLKIRYYDPSKSP